jgi:predicted transcriptional regulator
MTLKEVADLIQATVITGEDFLDREVECVFASDLMSDVLTIKDHDGLLLLTGLCNLQSMRTCEMADIQMVLVVRGKVVTEDMVDIAEDNDIVVLSTPYSMYKTSGILYNAGLPSIY